MSSQLSMTDSKDIICNSIRIIEGDNLSDDGNLFQLLSDKTNSKINVVDTYDKIAINAILENYYTQEETSTLLNLKLDAIEISNYYNKTETDVFLNVRCTTTETDAKLNLKANSADVYTQIESNNLLSDKLDTSVFNTQIALKADIANVCYESVLYTKTEIDGVLALKVDNTSLDNYFTKTEINTSFTNYYDKTATDNLLITKQNVINDGDLTIAKTINLQASLDGKQNFINNVDLTIAKTSGLQTALNAKINIVDVYYKSLLYTKTEIDSLISDVNITNYYTKTQSNNRLNAKQNTLSNFRF
jgi:hypothetical protein